MTIFKCKECNSTDIQTQAWVNANTLEYVDDICMEDDESCWCEDCEKHVELIIAEE